MTDLFSNCIRLNHLVQICLFDFAVKWLNDGHEGIKLGKFEASYMILNSPLEEYSFISTGFPKRDGKHSTWYAEELVWIKILLQYYLGLLNVDSLHFFYVI